MVYEDRYLQLKQDPRYMPVSEYASSLIQAGRFTEASLLFGQEEDQEAQNESTRARSTQWWTSRGLCALRRQKWREADAFFQVCNFKVST